jgi:hypothetical protein
MKNLWMVDRKRQVLGLMGDPPNHACDEAQCSGCGDRYVKASEVDGVKRWYVLGSDKAEFIFCSYCIVKRVPLPIPFQCLFDQWTGPWGGERII